ncbi:DSBA oxidoreductase [Saccharothrix sp. NRRL B-16348]|uniref:DsbA family protein n=1 Tax=Saccharothrix sp. NRRL B-16348 TaxID=1415542 RepID=UPI0006AFCB4C|nr:thioredoxin domain-containing protein [Saccharothrix sp. NRRL B-16348]KOX15225.1 DSBA oxidoreductase [Saccharothrix sp. NRRL B-16348]
MTKNAKVSLVVIAVVVAVVAAFALLNRPDDTPPATAGGQPDVGTSAQLVRPDSHRLSGTADAKVTVVEFLDLECEACRAAFPGVEKLRAEYGDRVSFVMRYFPIPSHRNAELAARAVEAAGRQGKLELMYRAMYETQPTWGEKQEPQREAFVGFAQALGLDVTKFETDLDDPAVRERVRKDWDDGVALNVRGTPTFFVNGTMFQGNPTYEALKAVIDRELTK